RKCELLLRGIAWGPLRNDVAGDDVLDSLTYELQVKGLDLQCGRSLAAATGPHHQVVEHTIDERRGQLEGPCRECCVVQRCRTDHRVSGCAPIQRAQAEPMVEDLRNAVRRILEQA